MNLNFGFAHEAVSYTHLLFSTARDVARVYQMLLNGGEIDGQRYLSKETCQLFTTETSKISRRGLGFDKPDADDPKKGNCAPAAPAEVYGHTGFTGTCAWVDPVNELVYVFLSNRIYPDVTNRKLNQLHIRERIQGCLLYTSKRVCPENATLRGLFLDYVRKQTAEGKAVTSKLDGRITIK